MKIIRDMQDAFTRNWWAAAGDAGGNTAQQLAQAFVDRVEADGGVVEAQTCLEDRIQELMTLGFWDQASAIWLPHGYKEGKLYAVKGGSAADFAFSRAGTRYRKGPTYVEDVPYNLLQRSEEWDNGAWVKTLTTVTPDNITPPTGFSRADRINLSATTALKRIRQTNRALLSYTWSVTLKAGTHQFVQLLFAGDVAAFTNIDLVNGTVNNAGAGTTSITSLGDGWYKVVFTNTATTANTECNIAAVDSLAAARAASTSSTGNFYVSGTQLVAGTSEREYFKTTNRQAIPAIDYTNNICPTLSLEPARTNSCLWSEHFADAGWSTTGVSVSTDTVEAPSGIPTADTLLESAGNGQHNINRNLGASAGTTYAWSVYAKQGAGVQRYISLAGFGLGAADEMPVFDLVNGTVDTPSTSTVFRGAFIKAVLDEQGTPTGWYRCGVIAQASGSNGNPQINMVSSPTDNTLSGLTYTGNGTSTIHLWGSQVEVGAYATSFIPTTSENVSRIADTVSALTVAGTNFFLNSEDFTNAYWTKENCTITGNAATAPDSTLTADAFVENTTDIYHRIARAETFDTNNRVSFYVKKATRNIVYIELFDSGTPSNGIAWFNLDTGTLESTTGTGISNALITDQGNGWYRIEASRTNITNTSVFVGSAETVGDKVYAGVNLAVAFYIWGAQREIGTVATAYAKTTTAIAHNGSVIGQTEGTIYIDLAELHWSAARTIFAVQASATVRVILYVSTTGQVILQIENSSTQAVITSASQAQGASLKIAGVYGPNYAALFINGVKIGEDLTVSVPACSEINFSTSGATGCENAYNGVGLSPIKMSDAEAIALTTP